MLTAFARPSAVATAAVLIVVILALGACTAEQSAPPEFLISVEAAREALQDVQQIFRDAFLRAMLGGYTANSNGADEWSPGQTMAFRWSEGTSFATGYGRFELTLSGYSVSRQSAYAEGYDGYIVSGRLVLDTDISGAHFSLIDVELRHVDPDEYPVGAISASIPRGPHGLVPATGFVTVDGRVFPASQLYRSQP